MPNRKKNNYYYVINEKDGYCEAYLQRKKNEEDSIHDFFIPDFIFDCEFLVEVKKHGWYKSTHGIQARIKGKTTRLAKFIINLIDANYFLTNKETEVILKDKSYFDYRLQNIIFINEKIARNLRKTQNKTGYRGVVKVGDKYRCCVNRIRVGLFDSPEEAAQAYNKKSIEIYGKFAYQNKIQRRKNKK